MNCYSLKCNTLVIILLVFISCAQKQEAFKPQEYNVRIMIPLSSQITFNASQFKNEFQRQWKSSIVCIQVKDSSIPQNEEQFAIADKKGNGLVLIYNSLPMNNEIANLIIKMGEIGMTDMKIMPDSIKNAIISNQETLKFAYAISNVSSKERMNFTAKLMITLAKMYPVIGYIDDAAQSFRTFKVLHDFGNLTQISAKNLFEIFLNIQKNDDKLFPEVHTHGMDQFFLPNLQIIDSSINSDSLWAINILSEIAIKQIESAQQLSPNKIITIDNTSFKIAGINKDVNHINGAYGTIGIKLQ